MTPAGKRLLDAARSTDNPYIGLHLPEQFIVDAVAAIEAEAVAAERARALPVIEAARLVVSFWDEAEPGDDGEWEQAEDALRAALDRLEATDA